MTFETEYEEKKSAFERFLYDRAERIDAPEPLKGAMVYALTSGGKRLRPLLLIEACRLFRAPDEAVFTAAAAVECIHTYSLVHDDLPAMDDDDFRRGKPTVHKVYGDGMAVLAGDALLNRAFELLFSVAERGPAFVRAGQVMATACGAGGLIGGQALDIENIQPDAKRLRYIYQHKTADLIAAAVTAGGILGGADEQSLTALHEYGNAFGFAFQVADDLLDEGEDKTTFVGLYGRDAARRAVRESTKIAVAYLGRIAGDTGFFKRLAQKSVDRKA